MTIFAIMTRTMVSTTIREMWSTVGSPGVIISIPVAAGAIVLNP